METFIIVHNKKYTPYGGMSYGGIMSMWLAAKVDGLSTYLCAEHAGKVFTRPLTEEQAERLAVMLRRRA